KIREAEARRAAAVLEVDGIDFLRLPDLGLGRVFERGARALGHMLGQQVPNVIYLPHPEETHPDHHAALPLIRAALACRAGRDGLPELRAYEVWSPMARHDWVEDISGVMKRKLRAIRCYRSQLRTFRFDQAVRGLNR